MAIGVGDELPSVTVREMRDDGPVPLDIREYCAGKKVVLFGVPGAYTPTCSAQHLPGFVQHADGMRAAGVDEIACISANDVFVMGYWGKEHGVANKVVMLADGNAEFAEASGLAMDGSAFGMGTRLKRFAMVLEDGVITLLNVEEPGAFEVSSAEAIMDALQGERAS